MRFEQLYDINGSSLVVKLGDIREARTEVVVTSDDSNLSMGGGTSAAIRAAAGDSVFEESRRLIPVAVGAIAVTGAGLLAEQGVRHIFHAATIPSHRDRDVHNQEEIIRNATRQALTLLQGMGLHTISFPALGTGFAGFDPKRAALAMCAEIRAAMERAPKPFTVEIWLMLGNQGERAAMVFFAEFTKSAALDRFVVPSHAVLLIHGIRTAAGWRQRVGDEIEESARGLTPIPIGYGFFNVVQFLLPFPAIRRKAAETVWLKAKSVFGNPNFDRVSIIAHSFGSWIAVYLLVVKPIRIHRLLLCGAIVDANFDWDTVSDRIDNPSFENAPACRVVNDCGTKDIWPLMAKAMTWGFGISGRWGFQHCIVADRFYHVDHSGFFEEGFAREYWVPALTGKRLPKGVSDGIDPPWALSLLTFVKIPVLLGFVGALAWIYF
ncbi:hypothetical protein B1C78_00170 [Thioalkalivibrio denitrificans]|uniref:Macro domain-containing protein n=1 Tax=Thioalkalivibrio denitrificans TaxID=108003 RepID=A0A1V3NUJ9_9GAMM|nr:macro domain-containing protein [Thioalkalivibrio denitrificans]OOG28797.1 hypothetical protein B1C78_00170 [Thioalkalivibrio denitrificans]